MLENMGSYHGDEPEIEANQSRKHEERWNLAADDFDNYVDSLIDEYYNSDED